jgi:hypothetical protein
MKFFIDRVYRLPRIWSNQELEKHAHRFRGDIVNVSAWQDFDKVSKHYRDYFTNATTYTLTNYTTESHGHQGNPNELFLDLQAPLPPELQHKFDVVFNHTTLEHIFDAQTAFTNLCSMSRDVVIIVLPFLQQYHSDMGDYWRFTPLAVKQLFEKEGFTLLYQSFNSHPNASVYTFTIASRQSEKWQGQFDFTYSIVDPNGNNSRDPLIGSRAFPNMRHRFRTLIKRFLKV